MNAIKKKIVVHMSPSEIRRIEKEAVSHFNAVKAWNFDRLCDAPAEGYPMYFRQESDGSLRYRRVATSPSPKGMLGMVSAEGVSWLVR